MKSTKEHRKSNIFPRMLDVLGNKPVDRNSPREFKIKLAGKLETIKNSDKCHVIDKRSTRKRTSKKPKPPFKFNGIRRSLTECNKNAEVCTNTYTGTNVNNVVITKLKTCHRKTLAPNTAKDWKKLSTEHFTQQPCQSSITCIHASKPEKQLLDCSNKTKFHSSKLKIVEINKSNETFSQSLEKRDNKIHKYLEKRSSSLSINCSENNGFKYTEHVSTNNTSCKMQSFNKNDIFFIPFDNNPIECNSVTNNRNEPDHNSPIIDYNPQASDNDVNVVNVIKTNTHELNSPSLNTPKSKKDGVKHHSNFSFKTPAIFKLLSIHKVSQDTSHAEKYSSTSHSSKSPNSDTRENFEEKYVNESNEKFSPPLSSHPEDVHWTDDIELKNIDKPEIEELTFLKDCEQEMNYNDIESKIKFLKDELIDLRKERQELEQYFETCHSTIAWLRFAVCGEIDEYFWGKYDLRGTNKSNVHNPLIPKRTKKSRVTRISPRKMTIPLLNAVGLESHV